MHLPINLEYAIISFCCKPIMSRTAEVKLVWRDFMLVSVRGEVCSLVTYEHGQEIPLFSFTRLLQLAEKLTFLVANKYLWGCTFLPSCNCSVLDDLVQQTTLDDGSFCHPQSLAGLFLTWTASLIQGSVQLHKQQCWHKWGNNAVWGWWSQTSRELSGSWSWYCHRAIHIMKQLPWWSSNNQKESREKALNRAAVLCQVFVVV